jgi:hypothetical protein
MSIQSLRSKPELQLVVLHPDHLLPHGSTLLRRNSDGSYTPYKVSSDKLLRQVDPVSILSSDPPSLLAPPFPPFLHQTTRDLDQTINVYFLLLNAEIKFQRFKKNIGLDKLHPDMRAIVEQTIKIVDLMYSQPVRSESCTAVEVPARSEWSMRPRPQGVGAVDSSEGKSEYAMEAGGGVGTRNDPALPMEGREREPHMSPPL